MTDSRYENRPFGRDALPKGRFRFVRTQNYSIRNGAGTGNASLTILPDGTKVQNYGYYTEAGGVKWLYVQVTYNGVKYTGFCSAQYLSK